jgi:subtilisin family serine protease
LGRFEHGSFVSSLIAARWSGEAADVIGVAPRGRIVAAVAFEAEAAEPWGAVSDLARLLVGLRYVVACGARVVNLSCGVRVDAERLERLNRLPLWDELERRGVILVCAAGNANEDNDVRPVFPASLPRSNVLSVMAVDAEGRVGRTWEATSRRWRVFSNYGAETVDLAAPGTLVLGACGRGEVALVSGTSYSAAMVSAAAALAWGVDTERSATEVIERIRASCRPCPALRGKCRTEGMLDLAALLDAGD